MFCSVIGGKRQGRRALTEERGQTLVEFALVLPLILLLVLGVIDIGKAVNYWNDETHLANEAARYAAVNNSPVAGQSIETAIKDQADTPELKNGASGNGTVVSPGVTVTICFPGGVSATKKGDAVKVTVDATYKWLSFLGLNLISMPLTATSTMRLETAYDSDTYSNNAYLKTGPVAC